MQQGQFSITLDGNIQMVISVMQLVKGTIVFIL
uniref:Uncharacterized protein n=1 Tax=Arundo donax TaxID=35708 RepID=A0A0A9BG87_ARUDO